MLGPLRTLADLVSALAESSEDIVNPNRLAIGSESFAGARGGARMCHDGGLPGIGVQVGDHRSYPNPYRGFPFRSLIHKYRKFRQLSS